MNFTQLMISQIKYQKSKLKIIKSVKNNLTLLSSTNQLINKKI